MGLDEFARSIPRRRLRWAAVAFSAVLVAGIVPGLAAGQEEEFVTGSGYASAQILRVGPTAGRLSLAPTLGLSLADYLNTVGRGQTTVADWAAIGVAQEDLPDNTPFLKVESTGDRSVLVQSESCTHTDTSSAYSSRCFVAGGTDDSGNGGGLMELFARATTAPFGESRFSLASFTIPGFIEVGEGVARTSSGVIDGDARVSTAVAEIGSLDFGGGAVKMTGLRWEAVQRTGSGGKKVTGKFTIQGASAGGVPMSIPAEGSELEPVLVALNTALAPTGFAISPPELETLGGVARVTPLSLEIVNSPLGRQFLAPIVDEIQPIRDPILKALITGEDAPFADASAAVLIADLTLGIASGASQLHIELGGANAFTEGERYTNPFSNVLELPPVVGGVDTVLVPGSPGTPGTPGAPAKETAELVAALPQGQAQKTVPGGKGGAAVMVGLIGLAVAGGLAAADWYRMRVARRAAAES